MASSTIEQSETDAVDSGAEDSDSQGADDGSSGRERSRRLRTILPLVSVAVFLVVWQIVGARVDPILLATPSETAKAFWDLLRTGQLGPAFGSAMRDLATGYVLAMVVGIALGIFIGRSPIVERVLNPYMNFFQATPLIALVPLVVIWFGVGLKARVTVTFILAVWSIIINTATGVKETPAVPHRRRRGLQIQPVAGGHRDRHPQRGSEHLRRPADRPRQSSHRHGHRSDGDQCDRASAA